MRKIVKEIVLYRFSELSEKAKDVARQKEAAYRFRSLFNECFGDTMRCRVLGVRPGMTEAHAAAVA